MSTCGIVKTKNCQPITITKQKYGNGNGNGDLGDNKKIRTHTK